MQYKLILILLSLLLVLNFSNAATLHGAIYDDSYELIKDVHVEINTSPKQNHISKNGLYFFNIPIGQYEITVEKFYQGELAYSASQKLDISKDGEFNIDIIVEKMPGVVIPENADDLGPSFLTMLRARFGWVFYAGIGFVFFVAFAVLVYFTFIFIRKWHKAKKGKSVKFDSSIYVDDKHDKDVSYVSFGAHKDTDAPKEDYDIDMLLNIIKSEGGRTTQKDIRRKIPLSEAKVSLMISELEASGKIKKIKKGRGNIIVINE